jgi:hypothetical protein
VAEILIQRKRHRRVWPWVLGLLVLVLLPWPFLTDREDAPVVRERLARRDTLTRRETTGLRGTAVPASPSTPDTTEAVTRTTATAAGAIAPATTGPPTASRSNAETVATTPPNPAPTGTSFERFIAARDPNPDERTHRRYTTTGLRRLADELRTLGASEAGVRTIRANADSVMSTAQRSARPDHARAAFLAAVREIDVLGGRYAVAVDTGRLRRAAWEIRPDSGLLPQRRKVQTFFETARDAVHALSRRR